MIRLATSAALPELTDDERLLLEHLDASPLRWGASTTDPVVVRTAWDYHERPGAFLDWIRSLDVVLNPADMIEWNLDKRYLLDLGDVPTVPTRFLRAGEADALADQLTPADDADPRCVAKPCIGAGASDLHVFDASDAKQRTQVARRLADAAAQPPGWLLQPFQPQIAAGEWSYMFFGGAFSHAIRKVPKAGDHRCQEEFGGHITAQEPEHLAAATAAHDHVADRFGTPTYARIDGLPGPDGWQVMEIELIEPALYLGWGAGSSRRFAEAIHTDLAALGAAG